MPPSVLAAEAIVGRFSTGQPVRRKEDQRFITGSGRYTDDITLGNQAYLYLFRSPYAHGTITTLDVTDARNSAGVLAVYTAAELTKAGIKDVMGAGISASSQSEAKDALCQPPLARGRVRYVGEPVAGIVAESLVAARDAAELIWFEVDEESAAATIVDALQDDAVQIHDGVPGNSYGHLEFGDRTATDNAFDDAATTVEIEIINNRLAPTAMEPRGCNIAWDGSTLTVYQGCQGVHPLRRRLNTSLDLDPDNIHVISPDVGGAFGLKFFVQCESVVAAHAAMDIGRPVKWTGDRNESFLSDLHGRDHVSRAELAIDEHGRFTAMRVSITGNLGAYCSQAGPIIPWFGASMTTGCYDIPVAWVDIHMVVTNTVPTDAYRGAGRPEAAYLVERLVDKAAKELGLTPDEIRRRNFIRPDQFPYETPTGRAYDSGNYEALMTSAMRRADWDDFAGRRAESARNGRLRGIGLCYYVEICSGLGSETTHVRFEESGRITVLIGTQSSGQGHETSFAQIVAAELDVDIDQVDIVQGDTELVPTGDGTGGSRSMVIGGSSIFRSVTSMIESGRKMAAEVLEAAVADIEFEDGTFRIAGTDRSASLSEVATASFDDAMRPDDVEPGLYSSENFLPEAGTFPNGCHICEVEVDPDTGVTDILRYTVEDDVGKVINPLLLEGQIMGGIAQGLGQACGEHAVYESNSGQLLTATFMDYPMPRADWIPDVDFQYQEVASPRNPLGVKGAGEAGTVGATPAYIIALLDALSVRGIEHIDMPATPLKVWSLLHNQEIRG
jgi:carbon-monoxide dehydrogenase large subunit